MREKPSSVTVAWSTFRITPASAGKTEYLMKLRGITKDHPRECGKNISVKPAETIQQGSPPRVREKPSHLKYGTRSIRITPASAGKTLLSVVIGSMSTGSPPRVREKLKPPLPLSRCVGITPASAGKTNPTVSKIVSKWDHPRECGKNCYKTKESISH